VPTPKSLVMIIVVKNEVPSPKILKIKLTPEEDIIFLKLLFN
jgi:hypothetical protein